MQHKYVKIEIVTSGSKKTNGERRETHETEWFNKI